ncbi:two-component response regulator-like APRR2 isoform X1 [Tanacetum coccineum]
MADYSQKWHNGTSTRNKNSNTFDGLAAIQAQLNNLSKEIKKVNERVYAAQFEVPFPNAGRYRAAAPGFYQRDNGNPSYQERRQMMEESLSKFMVESVKRQDENSSLINEIRASTDAAIRNQRASIKALKIQIGQMSKADILSIRSIKPTRYIVSRQKKDDKMQSIKLSRSSVPFPGHLKEYDEDELLKGLKKLQVNLAESATSLKRLMQEKTRIEEEIKATMNEHYSTIIKDDLHPKEKDLGSFTLPCKINNMFFDKALADLEASVSIMSYSTFTNLGLGKLAPTKLIIELADKTVKRPKVIAENVLVGIDKFAFLVDFIVLDMPEDIKIPLILRRPFLSTAHAKIDVFKIKIALRIRNDKIVFKSDGPTSNIIKKVYV